MTYCLHSVSALLVSSEFIVLRGVLMQPIKDCVWGREKKGGKKIKTNALNQKKKNRMCDGETNEEPMYY